MHMQRIGLITILIFSTAVGVLPCPFHFQPFSSLFLGVASQASIGDLDYEPCCPIPVKKLPSGGGLPSQPKCPCESRDEFTAFPTTRIQQTHRDSQENPVLPMVGANLCYQYIGSSNIAQLISDAPVLSLRDRLHVLCILLC
jgi:hypothetical protein